MTEHTKLVILLVEDNPGDARLVEILLSEADSSSSFEVVRVGCLAEAFERLAEVEFDVILLDMSLPDSSGLDTVERVRAAVPKTPLVILSGQGDEEVALRALQSGAEDYLAKGQGDGELVARSIRYAIERKKAKDALRESEERFRSLVRHASDIIMVIGPGGTIHYESPAIERVLGYQPEEWIGTNVFDHLHPDDLELVRSRFTEVLDEPGAQSRIEYRIRDKRGSWRYLEAICTNLLDDPVVGGIVVNSRDIPGRNQVEEALREVRKAERARLARDLHDGALQDLTYALAETEIVQMLSEDRELNDRLERAVDALRRSGQSLREAVYDLKLVGTQGDRTLPELVRSLVEESNQRMAPGCDVRLEVEEGFPSSPLEEAGTELLRVLQEALNNVRRHSEAKNVWVSLRAEEGELAAEISDDGRGFDPNVTRPGIGQRSMRERVAALGGELEVESEPGKGTRVRLRVPIQTLGLERSGER